jgi:DNA mismatch repair protein MutS
MGIFIMVNKNSLLHFRDVCGNMLCVIILIVSYSLNAQNELSFETIGSLRMRSFGLNLNEDNQPKRSVKDPKVALTVQLNDDDKRRLVYTLCAKDDVRRGITDNADLKTLFEDLDFFFGNGENPQETLFNRIYGNTLQTTFGEAMAAKRLATLVTDKEKLLNLQACIKELAVDQVLFEKVDALLQRLARAESNVLSFWAPSSNLTKRLVDQLYFGRMFPNTFNKSATRLEILTWLSNCSAPFTLTADIAVMTGAVYFIQKLFGEKASFKKAFGLVLDMNDPRRAIREFKHNRTAEAYAERDQMVMGIAAQHGQILTEAERIKRNKDIWRGFQLLAGLKFCSSIINIGSKINTVRLLVADFKQRAHTMSFLQERLMGVAEYIHVLRELYDIAQEYPVLAQALPIASVYNQLKHHASKEVCELIALLETHTFEGNTSFFSRSGRILAAYTLMNNVKNEFIDCLKLLGDVDVCTALSKVYTAHKGQRVGYAFAQYEQSDVPHIKVEDFWNPFVDQDKVVTNSMELGIPSVERGMILTGSNKGGKSTLLKAMMVSVVLAQTITLVPASFYSATLFDYMTTYMNVSDDTAAGKSLFQAQVTRAKKLIESIDALAEHKLGFVVIDEIFTGTNAKSASQAAYKLAKHIADVPSVCFVLATHFVDELSALEQDTQGICKNYNVDANKDEQGQIAFTYQLRPGRSTQNIASDILNQEFETIDF